MNSNWLSFSPHIRSNNNVNRIYVLFIISLLPAIISGITRNGLISALTVVIPAIVATCVDFIISIIKNKRIVLENISSVYIGFLIGVIMPHNASIFALIVAPMFAIIIVKAICNVNGNGIVSEVAISKILMLLMFGSYFYNAGTNDVFAGVLSGSKYSLSIVDIFIDGIYGGIGETALTWILLGGVFLCASKVIDIKVPVIYLGTVVLMGLLYWDINSVVILLSGSGAVIVAFYILTDYGTSPKVWWKSFLYALGAGVVTVIIWKYGKNAVLAPYYSAVIVSLIYATVKGKIISNVRSNG